MLQINSRPLIAGLMLTLLGCIALGSQNRAAGPVEFSLKSVDGQTVTSDSLRGEVVILAFGASWLPLSKMQLQGVRKLADEYSNRSVVVYWVSTESEDPKSKNYATDEQLRAFAQKYGRRPATFNRNHRQTGKHRWRSNWWTRSKWESRGPTGISPRQDSLSNSAAFRNEAAIPGGLFVNPDGSAPPLSGVPYLLFNKHDLPCALA